MPMTLVEYQLENKDSDPSSATTIYSFLNFEWAMVPDVDFESEKYRRTLGTARFTFTALQRIAFLRVYRGKLSFIEVNALNDSTWTHLNEQNYVLLLVSCLSFISRDFMSSPHVKRFDEPSMHLTYVTEGISKCELIRIFMDTSTGQHLNTNNPHVHNLRIRELCFEPIVNETCRREGIMMIDGERIPHYDRVYGRVRPGIARILTKLP